MLFLLMIFFLFTLGRFCDETPTRRERGLRVLSSKVRDIVSEKKRTTYKQVAKSLIEEMKEKLIFKEKVILI